MSEKPPSTFLWIILKFVLAVSFLPSTVGNTTINLPIWGGGVNCIPLKEATDGLNTIAIPVDLVLFGISCPLYRGQA